jgi:hypothetical protein
MKPICLGARIVILALAGLVVMIWLSPTGLLAASLPARPASPLPSAPAGVVTSVPFAPQAVLPGDCNGDQMVSAPDLTGVVLEILDGDGDRAVDTPGGSYRGNPGCDGNQDSIVDAGDLSCVVLLIFSGANACAH